MKLMITDMPNQGIRVRFPEELLDKYDSSIKIIKSNPLFSTTHIFQLNPDDKMLVIDLLFNDTLVDSIEVKRIIKTAFGLG